MNIISGRCVKRIIAITLFVIGFFDVFVSPSFAANAHSSNKAKIKRLKILENIETGKLYKNQQKLENTQNSLQKSKDSYNDAQNKLSNLQRELVKTTNEYSAIDVQMRRRICQIFKTQRTGFFEILIMAEDINDLSDRLYYEGIIIRKDFDSMKEARKKAKEVSALKTKIEQEKRLISNSITVMNKEQNQLKRAIVKNQKMILKLKTDRRTYEKAEEDLARNSSRIQSMLSKNFSTANALGTTFLRPKIGRAHV